MAAAGLQTSIWDNNIRSFILLAIYPFIIAAIIWAAAFAMGVVQGNVNTSYAFGTVNYHFGMAYANAILIAYWPTIVGVIAVWFAISYFYNSSLMRMLSRAHVVTRKEEPDLYNLLENLCISQGMKMPELNIVETDARNAFASGVDERSYAITVTRGLLNTLQKDEIENVLAHELTHIINRDVRLMMVTVIFTGMVGFAAQVLWSSFRYGTFYRSRDRNSGGIILVMLIVGVILWIGYMATLFMRFAISRRREYMADAGAVKITKNPDAMMRALLRIQGANDIPHASADVEMMCIENPRAFMGLFATHPPIEDRVKVLSDMTHTPMPALASASAAIPPQDSAPPARKNPWA